MSDNVNHPEHYKKNGIECIDIIQFILGETGAKFFCLGNVMVFR